MITAVSSTPFETCYDSGVSGLVGICSVQIIDNVGNITFGPTTVGVLESPPGSGVYCNTLTAPGVTGQYTVVWSQDGTFDPTAIGIDDLVVVLQAGAPGPLPAPSGGGIGVGPCSAWTTPENAAECCSEVEGDFALLVDAVDTASQTLYELSGRQFSGTCEKTVRPCGERWCGFQVLSRGHIVWDPYSWYPYWNGGSWWHDGKQACACQPLDTIKLSGYPVREITQVLIDGVVVDPDTYRLDEHRYLRRVPDPLDPTTALLWPSCQAMGLPDSASGTFSVTYTYGQEPPFLGIQAAGQLACELYKACTSGECALPKGTTRINRQGITIEKLAFTTWAFTSGPNATANRAGGWNTGLPLVDAFLNTYNGGGLKRRPVFWSPSGRGYARTVG